jgi:hypothetical protein
MFDRTKYWVYEYTMSAVETLRNIVKKCDELDRQLPDSAHKAVDVECTSEALLTKPLETVLEQLHNRIRSIRAAALSALADIAEPYQDLLEKNPHGKRIVALASNPTAPLGANGDAIAADRSAFYREQVTGAVVSHQKKVQPNLNKTATPPPTQSAKSFLPQFITRLWSQPSPHPAAESPKGETILHPEIVAIANTLAETDARVNQVRSEARHLLLRHAEAIAAKKNGEAH